MKFSIVLPLFLIIYANAAGQLSIENLKLDYGEHSVGYQHQTYFDSSRTYNYIQKSTNKFSYRPISTSIWYPATANPDTTEFVKTLNYMEVYKQEKEWEQLPNEQLLNWFEYHNTLKNNSLLKEYSKALKSPLHQSGKFPVVIYSPGYEGSSVENFALCELLASHGFVVIASPSRGHDNLYLDGGTLKDIEAQARDIEFLISLTINWQNIDHSKIALMGFSLGGLSNVLVQMRNESVKAVVSVDGSIKYQYEKIKRSSFFSIDKVDVPFIHLAQKDIPDEILKSDHIDPALNSEFIFFDELQYSNAYAFKFHDLTHLNFTSLGVLLENRDPRQDKSDEKIMNSYQIVTDYILNFLNAYLRTDQKSLQFLRNSLGENGINRGLISKIYKSPKLKPVTFSDFNEASINSNYENISKIYQYFKSNYAHFDIAERQLNTLALQWFFNSEKPVNGVKILKFAVSLYPHSSNLFDSLGEGYLVINENKKALASFREAVRLDSNNSNSLERIKQLSNLSK